jgi:hypothetical protein
MKGEIIMIDFTRELKEKAEKMGYEMKGLAQDMSSEMRDMKEIMKEKAEKFGDEIKKKMMR